MMEPRVITGDREAEAARRLGVAFGTLARNWHQPQVDIGPLASGFMPLPALFSAESFISAMLARQQAATPGLDEKGAAAFFIAEYASLLGIVVAVPYLAHALVPDLSPHNCALLLAMSEQGQPQVRLRFLSATCHVLGDGALSDDPRHLVHRESRTALRHSLADGLALHMSPLVEHLVQRTGLPAQAMWRLVADAVAGRFLDAGCKLDLEEVSKTEALAVLNTQGSPLANPQLHFLDITIHDDAVPGRVLARRSFRARGGCCRYYTAPGGFYCSSCVLLGPAGQRQRLEAGLRRKLGLPAHDEAPENTLNTVRSAAP